MFQIIGEYLEYLELEKGLAQNTLDAYRRDLSEFAKNIDNIESVLRFLDNSLIYYSTTLKYSDYKKYNKILKKKACYKHPIENGLKSKVRSIIIKTNSAIHKAVLIKVQISLSGKKNDISIKTVTIQRTSFEILCFFIINLPL